MTDTSFCPSCGERISAYALICPSCGTRQDAFVVPDDGEERPAPTFPTEAVIRAVPPPPADDEDEARPAPSFPTEAIIRPVSPPTAASPERTLRPALLAAGIAGAVAAAVVLVAGLLIALITPDASLIGFAGRDASLLEETFRQAVGTLLAPMVDPGYLLAGSRRFHPMLLLAIPLTALALATRRQLHRTEGATSLARLGWACLVALPFGVLMLVFALLGGETESTNVSPSAGNTLMLGLLWGVVGGLIGAATRLPLSGAVTIPPTARRVLTAVGAALRPLAGVLAICTLLALAGWLVQVAADAGGVRNGRSVPTALIEETVFAPEHGVHLMALGAGVLFRPDATGALGLPFPVDDPTGIPGADGALRIFAYEEQLPAAVFLPALVVLLCLNVLGALYAGFAAARALGATQPAAGAAWGALTGPAWAVVMAALVVLAGGLFHGDAGDGSVLAIYLIGGALLGALGGALAPAHRRE